MSPSRNSGCYVREGRLAGIPPPKLVQQRHYGVPPLRALGWCCCWGRVPPPKLKIWLVLRKGWVNPPLPWRRGAAAHLG